MSVGPCMLLCIFMMCAQMLCTVKWGGESMHRGSCMQRSCWCGGSWTKQEACSSCAPAFFIPHSPTWSLRSKATAALCARGRYF